jgi:hypothetical protein
LRCHEGNIPQPPAIASDGMVKTRLQMGNGIYFDGTGGGGIPPLESSG